MKDTDYMKSILVVAGAFSYNGQNQTKALLWTQRGKQLWNDLGLTGIYSTYTADNTLQDELSQVHSDLVFDNYLYLPCTPDGYLKGYDDPFLDKIYLTKIDSKYNAKACTIEDYKATNFDNTAVLKGRKSSGSKEVFYGIENWKAFKSHDDFIIQEFIEGNEYLFDVVYRHGNFLFTGRKNLKLINGRDKIIEFVTQEKDAELIEKFKELLISLKETFDLPTFFNVQFKVDKNGNLHIIEIDSRYSGTVACTTSYLELLRFGWLSEFRRMKDFEFIESKLDKENQDSNWKLMEVVK